MAGKLIRDAVHGDIQFGALEMELIDTPEFQRLRGIKQLGTAYLVFPSALHTRFEHSLGTSWMARKLADAVGRTHAISADYILLIRVTALLHDITHIPFGHTLEDERRILPRHDKDQDRVRYFLEEGNVGRILEREGIHQPVVQALAGGGSLVSDIAGGPISADLLDYLRRDTYFCGLSQYYDPRIFESFVVDNGRLVINLEKRGVLRQDTLSELVNLLRIRYTLSERVYFHHTKIASGAMICKAVELALGEGFDPEELRLLKDETLQFTLAGRYAENPGIVHLLDCLERRSLYRPCYSLTVAVGEDSRRAIVQRFHHDAIQRKEAEHALAAAAGLAPHQVIVYCPSFGMALQEADVPVRMEGGKVLPLSDSNNDEIRILKDKHKALWKFLVLVDRSAWDKREALATAAADFAGIRGDVRTG
jgi:HD superfamily phosphohydrolase